MPGKRYLYNKEFRACDSCHGEGRVSCRLCRGRGDREVTRWGYNSSNQYFSYTEQESCSFCNGTGKQLCTYCGGTGDQLSYGFTTGGDTDPTSLNDKDKSFEYAVLYKEEIAKTTSYRDEITASIERSDVLMEDNHTHLSAYLNRLDLTSPTAADSLCQALTQISRSAWAAQPNSLMTKLRLMAELYILKDMCSDIQRLRQLAHL